VLSGRRVPVRYWCGMSRRDSEHTQLIPVRSASPLTDSGTAVLPPLNEAQHTAPLEPIADLQALPKSPALPFIRLPAQTLTNESASEGRRSALPFVAPVDVPEDARDTLPPTVDWAAAEDVAAALVEDEDDDDDDVDTVRPARLATSPPRWAPVGAASGTQPPPPGTLPPGPPAAPNPFVDGFTAHLSPVVPLAPALPFLASAEGSARASGAPRTLAALRAELELGTPLPVPRGRFDTIPPPSEDLGGYGRFGFGAAPSSPALTPIPTEVLEVPEGALDSPAPPVRSSGTAPPPAYAVPIFAPRSPGWEGGTARARETAPPDTPVLRIEGLTLEEFSGLRAAIGSEPQRRRELLRARGLGEVGWRLCERRWAAHFRAMEVSPAALLEGLWTARRAARPVVLAGAPPSEAEPAPDARSEAGLHVGP
jgi:hypothetical protein